MLKLILLIFSSFLLLHNLDVECGLPGLISNGRWLINTTHYGSIAEYECDYNYRLIGPVRRICTENGTWSSSSPICELVDCGKPIVHDNITNVFGFDYSVNAKVNFSCEFGYQLVGDYQSICLPNGQWSSQAPICKVVDCGRPPVLAYGKGVLLNSTTTFGSITRYSCLPDYKMIGDPYRRCQGTCLNNLYIINCSVHGFQTTVYT